ncbi:MAG: transposase [Actinomycetota bacterium]|nr:transposase [Actinomycetota bacterium]
MDVPKVAPRSAAAELSCLLDSPEIQALVRELEETRWTGRPGYPIRCMVGMALAKSLYAIPTWTRTVRLVREHAALEAALGCADGVPSEWACYRFTRKLREHPDALARCLDGVTAGLHARLPKMGQNVAIDASDMAAYANGQRFVSKGGRERDPDEYSDPDASWGHRSAVSTRKGGGFYGYKLHMAVCADTDLPLAWQVETGRRNESSFAVPLLDAVRDRGFAAYTLTMDKGYDLAPIYAECEARDVRPIMPLRQTPDVKRGEHRPPTCEHGEWRFAGADTKRGASKWRCPTGECTPASVWIAASRLHPLIPRETLRWRKLYKGRASVERAFGRLKNDWALAPLRVRGIERVALHADLTVLAQLARALSRARTPMRVPRPARQAA